LRSRRLAPRPSTPRLKDRGWTADGLKELFKLFEIVTVKRMFGGHGVYAEGLCFTVESGGEVFLKVDADLQPSFSAAGSSSFI
jgi:DNA transformation protein